MALFNSIMGWLFPLRSWREQQGQPGGEDSVDSKVWAGNFGRVGPQIVGRTMFDYGHEAWGENPQFHAPVFVVTHRGQDRIAQRGGTEQGVDDDAHSLLPWNFVNTRAAAGDSTASTSATSKYDVRFATLAKQRTMQTATIWSSS